MLLYKNLLLLLVLTHNYLPIIAVDSKGELKLETVKNSLNTIKDRYGSVVLAINKTLDNFKLIIPPECEDVGICDYVPNYPQEYVSNIIKRLSNRNINLYNYVQPLSQAYPFLEEETGLKEDMENLCEDIATTFNPQAARDKDNNWHLVLNSVKIPQKISGKKCMTLPSNCSRVATFSENYYGKCMERKMNKKLLALDLPMENVIALNTEVPCCCMCVAVHV